MNIDSKITARQNRILELLSLGYSNKEIANKMGVSTHTIGNTLTSIKEKVNCSKQTELSLFYLMRRFNIAVKFDSRTQRAVSFMMLAVVCGQIYIQTIHVEDMYVRRNAIVRIDRRASRRNNSLTLPIC